MKRFLATIALGISLGALSQGQQPADEVKPYSIKQDILGESLAEYKQNNISIQPPQMSHPSATERIYQQILTDCAFLDGAGGLQTTAGGDQECMTANMPDYPNKNLTYAGIKMASRNLGFYHGHLFRLTFIFAHGDYEQLRDALIAKFGPASQNQPVQLQNKMGASFEGHNLIWKNGISTIRLHEYVGSVEESVVDFSLDSALAEVARNKAEAEKSQAKKDM